MPSVPLSWVLGGIVVVGVITSMTVGTGINAIDGPVNDIERALFGGDLTVAEATPAPNRDRQTQSKTGGQQTRSGPSSTKGPTITPTPTESSEDVFEREVAYLVHQRANEIRAGRGGSQMKFSNGLNEVANYHSEDMAASGTFSHKGSDGDTMETRFEAFGIECKAAAENIAKTWYKTPLGNADTDNYYSNQQELARGLVRQWMNSPGHKQNLLRSEWTHSGVGVELVEEDGNTAVYATHNFCRP